MTRDLQFCSDVGIVEDGGHSSTDIPSDQTGQTEYVDEVIVRERAATHPRSREVRRIALAPKIDADTDTPGDMTLHEAVQSQNKRQVKLLLKHNASLDVVEQEGRTPLHIAVALKWNDGVVKLLLEHNASVDVTDQQGRTPPHVAAAFTWNSEVAKAASRAQCECGRDGSGRSDTTSHRSINGEQWSNAS